MAARIVTAHIGISIIVTDDATAGPILVSYPKPKTVLGSDGAKFEFPGLEESNL